MVEVRSASGVWEQREVEIGMNDGVHAQVLSGLQEGDIVRFPLQDSVTQNPWDAPMTQPTVNAPEVGHEEGPPADSDDPDAPSVVEPKAAAPAQGPASPAGPPASESAIGTAAPESPETVQTPAPNVTEND